ncbi:hypothetical protein [Streptomyces sp. NPDC047061]
MSVVLHADDVHVVLTGDRVGTCFGLSLTLERHGGRWTVRVETGA